jgi:hypothetical protein
MYLFNFYIKFQYTWVLHDLTLNYAKTQLSYDSQNILLYSLLGLQIMFQT